MRLDLFLKKTCIVGQRSVAKAICDAGAARLNDQVAKAAQTVRAGDRIALHLAHRDVELCVLEIPVRDVAKRDAPRYVEILRDTPRDRIDRVFGPDEGDLG